MGTGFMGMERIDFAEKRLTFAINTQKSRGLKVDTVHVAVFGFSRGATLARAFVNRLAKQAKQQGGQWFREGARLRIYFVGIFDTVASVGLPREHNTYARELGIPSIVERCVHMVAAHELRFAFPLDSVRRDGHYPANTVEYVYPGMHSDVGGGYATEEQGRFNAYEKLPLHRMYHEAEMAGVPLLPPERWDAHIRSLFSLPDRFTGRIYRLYECTRDDRAVSRGGDIRPSEALLALAQNAHEQHKGTDSRASFRFGPAS